MAILAILIFLQVACKHYYFVEIEIENGNIRSCIIKLQRKTKTRFFLTTATKMRLKRRYSNHALLLLSVTITAWLQQATCKRSQTINQASPTPKRSAQRATDIDDGKEHNITIVYDRVNGLSGASIGTKSGSKAQSSHHHPNKIPHLHKISNNKKLHSQQQKFVPQKVETSRGSKRQLPPPGAMFGLPPPQAELLPAASSPMMSQMFNDPAPVGFGPAGAAAATNFDQDDIDGNEATGPVNDGLVPVGPVENVFGGAHNAFGGIHNQPQPISTSAMMTQNLPVNLGTLQQQGTTPINIGTGNGVPIDGGSEQTLHNVQTHTSNYVMPPKHVYVQGRVHSQSK